MCNINNFKFDERTFIFNKDNQEGEEWQFVVYKYKAKGVKVSHTYTLSCFRYLRPFT